MGGKVISGLKAPTLASTNITWEKVTTTNFGLDIAMLNNRLNASFDYYIRNTNDMVISKTYPAVLGSPVVKKIWRICGQMVGNYLFLGMIRLIMSEAVR